MLKTNVFPLNTPRSYTRFFCLCAFLPRERLRSTIHCMGPGEGSFPVPAPANPAVVRDQDRFTPRTGLKRPDPCFPGEAKPMPRRTLFQARSRSAPVHAAPQQKSSRPERSEAGDRAIAPAGSPSSVPPDGSRRSSDDRGAAAQASRSRSHPARGRGRRCRHSARTPRPRHPNDRSRQRP